MSKSRRCVSNTNKDEKQWKRKQRNKIAAEKAKRKNKKMKFCEETEELSYNVMEI